MSGGKKTFYVFTLITVALFLSVISLHAGITAISGLTLSPANPSPGDNVTATWNYTSDYGPEPEKYFIAVFNQCAIPATGGGSSTQMKVVVGDACAAPTPSACLSCVSASGCGDIPTPTAAGVHAASKTFTMPLTLIPGNTYYAIVAMGSYNVYMNPDLTASVQMCAPFTVPLTSPYINLNKVAEGTTGSVGQSVLFTIYYDVGNIHNFTITDAVDSRFTITQVFNGGTRVGQNITWNINAGYITSPQQGSVSFLATINAGTTGTIIPNTAVGHSAEIVNSNSNIANVVIGQPGLSIDKNASAMTVNTGDTVTYTMQYINQGTTLVEFDNFDDGTIPAGWTNTPAGGTWNAIPGYLQQTAAASGYTGYMKTSMTPIHDGIYILDMLIPSANTAHWDGVMHFIQVDANNFYMARINASDDRLYLDKVVGGVVTIGGASVPNPHGQNILQDVWYTLKVQVCGSSIMMKVWPKGDNEYPAWDLSVTDASVPGNGIVGVQANEGAQQYDNLKVFSLTSSTNPRIFDSVPTGITYIGASAGGTKPGSVVNWSVGSTCAGAQAVSWWGQVTAACGGAVTNEAGIDSDDAPPPVISNKIIVSVRACVPTPSFTPTNTRTFTPTPSVSATFTQTYTRTPSPTFTRTATVNNTATYTQTMTFTLSRTMTYTLTMTHTLSATRTYTQTLLPSPTNTPSPTQTSVNTATFTPSRTNTATASPTFTRTVSPTGTASVTSTHTLTPTLTPTLSSTVTASPTFSSTRSFTATYTFTGTVTQTFTPTYTATATFSFTVTDTISSNTPTHTLTSTGTFTVTPSFTATNTPVDTSTFTATATGTYTMTFTQTVSASPTNTYTSTFTETFTATPSLTATDTISSNTPTATPTVTLTFTATPSMTWTFSSTMTATDTVVVPSATFTSTQTMLIFTATDSPTATDTMTYTATHTSTRTNTVTPTFTLTDTNTLVPTASFTSTSTPTITLTPSGAPVELDIRITASGDDPAPGAVVRYSIRIENNGTGNVYGIAVWDTLPSNMSYISSVTPNTPAVTGQYLFWDLGSAVLAFGEIRIITFTAMINSVADGSIITTTAGTDYYDPFYSVPGYRHPPVFSQVNYYPEGDVRIFPNPFYITGANTLKFINVTPGSNILIYTVSGESVAAIYANTMKAEWNGKNRHGNKCSEGIYYYVVVNQQTKRTRTGKLFITKE